MSEPQLWLTFGQKYHREPHSKLPWWACNPDGWLEVHAPTEAHAHALARDLLAGEDGFLQCAGIYSSEDQMGPHWYPLGCLAVLAEQGLAPSPATRSRIAADLKARSGGER